MSSQAARSTGAREPGDGARMGAGLAAPRAAAAMAAAARGLLGAVTGEQAYVLNPGFDDFDLGSPRRQWTYLPELERPGLPLRAMSDPQRKLAHELITASVSMEGYAKVDGHDPGAADEPWGWQLAGHHVSLNFTVAGGRVSGTPCMLGSVPASYGPLSPLAHEETHGQRFLLLSVFQKDWGYFAPEFGP